MAVLAFDIGGSKIEICRVDDNLSPTLLEIISSYTKNRGSLGFIDDIKNIIQSHLDAKDEGITLSLKSLVHNNIVLKSSLLNTENYDLATNLEQNFNLPCQIENDVICATLAEKKIGIGQKENNFTLINIGAGTRIAHCEGNIILRGYRNQAGEISSLFAKITNNQKQLGGQHISEKYYQVTGKWLSAKEIFSCTNDNIALKLIKEFSQTLAELFRQITFFYNPSAIILTGSIFKPHYVFLDDAIELFKKKYPKNFLSQIHPDFPNQTRCLYWRCD